MGDKIFFPNSAQFDEMNQHLARIASAVGSHVDISTWGGIQKAVRAGIAPDVLPIGTQLTVSHSYYGDHLYDVVAHDYFKSVHNENAHTMTLLSHDVLGYVAFDGNEAFYRTDTVLPAGTYNFTLDTTYTNWTAGTYQFTLTQPLYPGGCLMIGTNTTISLLNSQVISISNIGSSGGIIETRNIESGNGGTSLGTLGVELNHPQRVATGSNNYGESAIRQFLNSPMTTGDWWVSQTKFDRPPNNRPSFGFMSGFDDEFLACVGEVIVPCATNARYEAPNSATSPDEMYTVNDRFYLLSQTEISDVTSDMAPDLSQRLPYFKNATNADRIKYKDGAVTSWWTRSANRWSPNITHSVTSTGAVNHATVSFEIGLVPAFTIV